MKGGFWDGRAGDLGENSPGGSSNCGFGKEGAGELGMELIGGLVERRMLTSGERSIWRIGSLQSVNSNPVEEVVGVAVGVSDGLLRFDEGGGREV